jgi:hypothetical protein
VILSILFCSDLTSESYVRSKPLNSGYSADNESNRHDSKTSSRMISAVE